VPPSIPISRQHIGVSARLFCATICPSFSPTIAVSCVLASHFFFSPAFFITLSASPQHIAIFVSAPYFHLSLCFFSLTFFVSLSSLSPTHCCVCECPVFSPLTFCFFSVSCFFCAPFHPNLSPMHRCECAPFSCHYPSQLLTLLFFFSPAFFVTLSSLSPTHCHICECPVFSLIALLFFTCFFCLPVQPLPNALLYL